MGIVQLVAWSTLGGSPAGLWLIGQSTNDVPSPLLQLGAFAAAAAVGGMFLRDALGERNRLRAGWEQIGPLLVELRDIQRANTEALRANADASRAQTEAMSKAPSEREIILLRDALSRLHDRDPDR